MKRKRDPRRKKALELERDHRVFSRQGNKSFRKAGPLAKAMANRKVRRAEGQAIRQRDGVADEVQDGAAVARVNRRGRLKKEGVASLAQALEVKDDTRLRWSRLMELNKEARRPATRRLK